jgi:small-conductance mechanosensitive channel
VVEDQIEPTVRKLEGFFWLLPNLCIAIAIFLLFLLAAWAASRLVAGLFRRRQRESLGELLAGFARWTLILFGLLVVATIVFPSIKPADLLATLGIGSVAIGFAFKDILQNWLSSLLILYRQPFRVGDQIVSGGFEGTVESIEARATMIRTYDGQLVVIPNSDIYTGAVTVRTAAPIRRSEYDVGIGYGDEVGLACAVIERALAGVEGVKRDPAPQAIPWTLDPSSVGIKVCWWSGSSQAEVVHTRGRVVEAVKRALEAAGVELPFPTSTVLFHDRSEPTGAGRSRDSHGPLASVDATHQRRPGGQAEMASR